MELGGGSIIQRALDGDGLVQDGQVLAGLEHLAHDAGSGGCPGTILHQGDCTVLVVALGQMLDEGLGEREDEAFLPVHKRRQISADYPRVKRVFGPEQVEADRQREQAEKGRKRPRHSLDRGGR